MAGKRYLVCQAHHIIGGSSNFWKFNKKRDNTCLICAKYKN